METAMQVANDNPLALHPQTSGEMVQSSGVVADVMVKMKAAKAFPRNEVACIDKMRNACMRKGLASSAIYSYAKGGTSVEGPSIRLLETVASLWGNIKHGYRIIERGVDYTKIEAFCFDMETNTEVTREETVRHYRKAGGKEKYLDDVREVRELVANFASRAERSCMEKVIPRDVVEECIEQCNQTLKNDNTCSDPEKIKALIAAFADFGVTVPMLEARIQRHVDSILPAQVVSLRKIYTSLKDGMSTADQWFTVSPQEKTDGAASGEAPKSTSAEDVAKAFGMKRGSDIKPPAKKPAKAEAAQEADDASEME